MNEGRLEKIMIVLSAMGALLSMYLLYTTLTQDYGLCPTNGCQVVGASEYSYFIGLPVALWGLGYYLVVFLAVTQILNGNKVELFKKALGLLLLVGVLFTIYLRYLEFFVIEAICFWCWGSVLFVAGLVVCYFLMRKRDN
jgi:uncharacterized membrane protein